MRAFLRRLVYWVRGRRAAIDLEEELRFHRDMAERDFRLDGLTPRDATRAAHHQLGNTIIAREDARAVWVSPWIDALWQDVRHGARSLRRSPGLVVVSAISLGLGIGLNTILFMGISTVYGHQPTMVAPERVVGVEPGYANQFSYPDYRDLRDSGIFADAVGFRTGGMNLGASGRTIPVSLSVVTANYFTSSVSARRSVGPSPQPKVRQNAILVSSLSPPASGGTGYAATLRRLVNRLCSAVSRSRWWACFPTSTVPCSVGSVRRSTSRSAGSRFRRSRIAARPASVCSRGCSRTPRCRRRRLPSPGSLHRSSACIPSG